MHPECPFCLANGLLNDPPWYIHGTAYALFQDNGTFLIIPAAHNPGNLFHPDLGVVLYRVRARIGEATAYNISMNLGETAGQRKGHPHWWVIPRYEGQPASSFGLNALITVVNNSGLTSEQVAKLAAAKSSV